MPLVPRENMAAGAGRRGNNPAAARLGQAIDLVINGIGFPKFPSFKKGTCPSLLDAGEAQKVKMFIENILFNTSGRVVTGSPQRNRAELVLTPDGNFMELWLQTDLRWDTAPMLMADLNTNNFVIYSPTHNLFLATQPGLGVVIQNQGGGSGLLTLGRGMPGTVNPGIHHAANVAPDDSTYYWPNDGSNGQVLTTDGNGALSWGAGGGVTDASYVVIAASGDLSAERVLTAGSGISITDGGANSTVTIAATGGGGGAPTDASYVVMGLSGALSEDRVLTAGAGISIDDGGANSTATIAATFAGFDVSADEGGGYNIPGDEHGGTDELILHSTDGKIVIDAITETQQVEFTIPVDYIWRFSMLGEGESNNIFVYDMEVVNFMGDDGVTVTTDITPPTVMVSLDVPNPVPAEIVACEDKGDGDILITGSPIPASGSMTWGLSNTGVSAASYGSATKSPTFTVDARGRITAASENTIPGAGGMTSFDLDGDSGSTQTITNGNTVTLAGGNGLASVASATDTVTVAIDDTLAQSVAITADGGTASGDATVSIDNHSTANTVGLVAGSNVTLTGSNSAGTIKVAASGGGGGGMTSWDLDGDSGSTQTISDGNTVTLAGGNGIASVASATDTLTVAIDDTIAQSVAITADGGTASGDATVSIDNHSTANTVGLVAGDNVTLTGSNSAGTIKVEAAAGGGGGGPGATELTSGTTYTASATDDHIYFLNQGGIGATFTLTLPAASTKAGVTYRFYILDSNYETFKVATAGSDVIYDNWDEIENGTGGLASVETVYQFISIEITCDGDAAWVSSSFHDGSWYGP